MSYKDPFNLVLKDKRIKKVKRYFHKKKSSESKQKAYVILVEILNKHQMFLTSCVGVSLRLTYRRYVLNIVSNCANWQLFSIQNKANRKTNLKMIKNYCYNGEKFGW